MSAAPDAPGPQGGGSRERTRLDETTGRSKYAFAQTYPTRDSTPSSGVTAIRVSTNSVIADIPVGKVPSRMVITPNGRTVYTINLNDNTVTPIRVSTNTQGRPSRSGGLLSALP